MIFLENDTVSRYRGLMNMALRTLPTRVTTVQYARLTEARAKDGLSIQEHVRRALDFYLDGIGMSSPPSAREAVDLPPPPRTPPKRVRRKPDQLAAPPPLKLRARPRITRR